jgi:hypothetical protein
VTTTPSRAKPRTLSPGMVSLATLSQTR